jgi:hypothetical protein
MGRPAGSAWKPLGLDTDPVPGDPQRISQEAAHLASVAAEISRQVVALRTIASGGDEIGKHADEICSSASDLAGQLDKVVGRYQKVSAALNGWIPDLEQAQSVSLQALNQAEGPYQQVNQTVVLPSGSNLTAQQQQSITDYHTAMKRAQGELDAALALLRQATTLRDNSGSYHAGLINQACDDGMKDSWWDQFKDFISEWSWLISDICTVLEVLATIAAIVAFILAQFVPGLDVLVDALVLGGLIATGVAAGGRLLLAATGNGSWWDFALDAFALLTFGTGRLAGLMAKGLTAGVETASKAALASELMDAVMQESPRGMMLMRYAMMNGVSALDMAGRLGEFAPSLAEGADSLTGAMKVMNSLGTLGEEGNTYAKLLSLSARFTGTFGDLSDITAMSKTLLTITGTSAGVAGVTGITATTLGGIEIDGPGGPTAVNWHIPGVTDWYHSTFEDPTTGAISTSAANAAVDTLSVAAPVVGIPMEVYRLTHSGF